MKISKKRIVLLSMCIAMACSIPLLGFNNPDKNTTLKKTSVNLVTDIEKISKNKLDKKLGNIEKKYDNVWKLNKNSFQNDAISVEIDDNNKPIAYINKNELKKISDAPKMTRTKRSSDISNEELSNKANDVAKLFNKSDIEFEDQYYLPDGSIMYKWIITFEGYKFDCDFSCVILNPKNGEIIAANRVEPSTKPIINVKINDEEALIKAKQEFSNNNNIKIDSVKKNELLIVNPNTYWQDKSVEYKKDSRLAYAITFEKKDIEQEDIEQEATIWIDAETGDVIGGCQTK